MRDMLIDALNGALKDHFDYVPLDATIKIADQLLAEGIVVPPCHLGDMVHRADGVWTVCGFDCNRGGKWTVKLDRWKDQFQDCHEYARAPFYSFGKTVFLVSKSAQTSEK